MLFRSQSSNNNSDNNKNNKFSWPDFWKYYLFFFYFSGLYQIIIITTGTSGGVGLRQAIYMSFLWLIPILLFPKYSKLISGITGLILWVTSLVSMGYLALYGQDFSQSVLFIIFESNFNESKEFLESYFRFWMLPALIVYSLIPWIIWKYLKPLTPSKPQQIYLTLSLLFIVGWPGINQLLIKHEKFDSALDKQINRMEPAAPWQLVMGYIKYKKTLADIEKHLLANEKLPPIAGLYSKNADHSNTLVLVIGESTNRQRMSLYGYPRKTTPRLDAIKDELLVFDNIYSPRPYTIETLQQVLTFADQQNPDLYLRKPTLINIMKQAGYKTYWITNQQTQTKRNTILTTFSKQADEQIYLNNNRMQDSSQYDGKVIEPFKKILNDSTEKKFIVIHLLGTHRKYHYRFPEEFALFKGNSDLPKWLNKRQIEEYNDYDNAVLYNDFVVSNIVNEFKASKDHGLLIYFSDHGEEVYDNAAKPFAGRNEGAPTSAMYTVPFIVWRSDSWKQVNPLTDENELVHRTYSTSDFLYTWSDLTGIVFNEFDPTRSIVSQDFQPHPVWIGDPSTPSHLRDLQKQPFPDLNITNESRAVMHSEPAKSDVQSQIL